MPTDWRWLSSTADVATAAPAGDELLADRLALALVNRQQVKPEGFAIRDNGAVEMSEATRRTVVSAYQERKRDEVSHPLLEGKVPLGRVPFLQARILARTIRGDLAEYVPYIPKN